MAFEDIDAPELYPCVMFYSGNPGEKVSRICRMKLMSILRTMCNIEGTSKFSCINKPVFKRHLFIRNTFTQSLECVSAIVRQVLLYVPDM